MNKKALTYDPPIVVLASGERFFLLGPETLSRTNTARRRASPTPATSASATSTSARRMTGNTASAFPRDRIVGEWTR